MNVQLMDKAVAVAGNCKQTGAGEADPLAPVTLHMPVPPSVNQAYKNIKRGKKSMRAKTKAHDDWLHAAYTMIRQQKLSKVKGRCIVVIGVERKSLAADIDNRIKLTLDALVVSHIIEDDRFVTAIAITWSPQANNLAHIQIYPIQPLGLQFYPSSEGTSGAWVSTVPPQEQET